MNRLVSLLLCTVGVAVDWVRRDPIVAVQRAAVTAPVCVRPPRLQSAGVQSPTDPHLLDELLPRQPVLATLAAPAGTDLLCA